MIIQTRFKLGDPATNGAHTCVGEVVEIEVVVDGEGVYIQYRLDGCEGWFSEVALGSFFATEKEFAMKFESSEQVVKIGTTIRSVTEAQSKRFFKTELADDGERNSLVYATIAAEVSAALYDHGFSIEFITNEIDLTDVILEQMAQDGYDVSLLAQALADAEEEATTYAEPPCW